MQARTSHAEQLADFADLLTTVARLTRTHTVKDPAVLDLSATEITVLRFIDHHPDVSPSAVAAGTGLQRSNLSRALRDLEARGLVRRTPDPADNRQAVLRSTARAAQNLARVRAVWARVLDDALRASGEHHDIAEALPLLRALERGLSD
jgi:DNA-binding MarR family transcriptional regulator